ncbi:MAG: acetyl-CoA C-acetyltransferase [Chloroflexi bacterium]|nr:acetyl-CoA C-acetyltransferase [Chloroflexota bacterium]MCL5110877.1 acetyl-CoA C-acetyltransferase [Chloroflexota bacterium]
MADSPKVVIASAARIPTGRFLGALQPLTAPELGAVAIRESIRRAGVDPAAVDEVIMGNVVQAGVGMAPARQAAVRAGVPVSVPAVTVNKVCGSGLKAVMLAAQAIKAGDGSIYVAGGMESMSNGPYLLPRARTGYRLGNGEIVDATVHDGLWCSFEHHHMGNSAEHIAKLYGISRREQDEFALASHRKAVAAASSGRFAAEIVPVEVPQKKGSVVVAADETPRPDTSLEALARLQPAFQPEGGTVTAGNAPGLSDGAAALVVVEGGRGRELGLPALARVTGYATAALEPLLLFAAPPLAIRKLLSQTGLGLNDFDLIEINEAFASQVLANGKDLGWDWQKVNVHGGAVALGHPIGASGARILTTLIYALRQRGGERGLAVACLGGGEAVALSVELA